MIRRPSQNLPAGCPKKVSPFGGLTGDIAAEIPPVSEFESPKLYIAGNWHPFELAPLTKAETKNISIKNSLMEFMIAEAKHLKAQTRNTHITLKPVK